MLIMAGDTMDTSSNLGLILSGLTFTTNGSAATCCDGIFLELKTGQKMEIPCLKVIQTGFCEDSGTGKNFHSKC